jgi:putative phosphoesterase
MNIGVISDTHGLIRPEALAALGGCELILHAGDVGSRSVLEALGTIAPVVAVRGNSDKGPWAQDLPVTEVAEADGQLIYLLHDLGELDLDPAAAGFRVVISGHSHRPTVQEKQGVLYLNPGSAGPRRFKLPVTVARLRLDANHADSEILELFSLR